jgi:predicted ATP-grasp superfamily ATP-dependent carboligase
VKTEAIDCVIPVYEETFHHALNHGSLDCDHFCSNIKTVDRLHNKFEFIQFAKSIGLNVPETILVENISQIKSKLTPDYILKPVYSRFGENVIIKPNPNKLKIDVSETNPWILQKRLDGKQYCLQGICKDGKVLSCVAYSSDFTVSKSSVFFEKTGKGDLGGIVEKVASNCNYTGFLSFDVILGEDGIVRPIECNPRATSALHLYSNEDKIDNAILQGDYIQCTGTSRRLVLPMWINLVSNLFKKSHFKNWRKATKRSKSVEWNAFDPRPGILQLILLLGFTMVALRRRISLISATTYEFEWNGK